MNKLTFLAFLIISPAIQAQELPKLIANHASGFVTLACRGLQTAKIDMLKVQEDMQDQSTDYFYDLSLTFRNGRRGQLRIAQYSLSNFSYANIKILHAFLPNDSCAQSKADRVFEMTCGDHWYSFSMKMQPSENIASFYFEGDSNPKIKKKTTRIILSRRGNILAYLPFGKLLLQKKGKDWKAILKKKNNSSKTFSNCRLD